MICYLALLYGNDVIHNGNSFVLRLIQCSFTVLLLPNAD